MTTSPLIPIEEAAKAMGVGRDTLKHMIIDGDIPSAWKKGSRYVILRAPFTAMLAGTAVPVSRATRHAFIRRVDVDAE
jgi:excisionase family DNA binding protein